MQTDIDYSSLSTDQNQSSIGWNFLKSLGQTIAIMVILVILGLIYASIVIATHVFPNTNVAVIVFFGALILAVFAWTRVKLNAKLRHQQQVIQQFALANNWHYEGSRKASEFTSLMQQAFNSRSKSQAYVVCSVSGLRNDKQFELLFLRQIDYAGRFVLIYYATAIRTQQLPEQPSAGGALSGSFPIQHVKPQTVLSSKLIGTFEGYNYVMTDSITTTAGAMRTLFDLAAR